MKSKQYVYVITIIFILSLIPLYIIGKYNHPSVDDYYYGVETAKVYRDTGSVSQVISTSFDEMKNTYNDWQGNFAAIFLMRLQPAVFGESAYVLSSVILITSFVAAMLAFIYNFLRKWFDAGRQASIITALAVTFCAMQFTIMPSDSFYWYNGSVYYTFFFSLALFLLTLVTVMIKSKAMPARIIAGIFAVPLAFIIGGGNYATSLVTVLILITLVILMIVKKNKSVIPLVLITCSIGVSFALSILAPGNAIRQEAVGGSHGVIKSIICSFAYGGYSIASSTLAPVLILFIMLIPLLYRIAKRSSLSFKHPVLVLLFTFCLFCSQGTPVFYAQGLRMPYRMMNIINFSYYIFMIFNLVYILGYIGKKYGDSLVLCKFARFFEMKHERFVFIMSCTIIFAISCVGLCKVSEGENGGADFSNMPLSVSATYSLINGDAKQYDKECRERAEYLSGTEEKGVTLAPLSVTPAPIFHTDITADPLHWKNAHLALFYGKDWVKLSNK